MPSYLKLGAFRTSLALTLYREIIIARHVPTMDEVSQILECLQLPFDANLKSKLVENIGVSVDSSRSSRLCSLVDGFAEYDPRAFSLLEVRQIRFKYSLF